ncbi:MAG: lipoprotein [Legionellaceae bacterium]|nr:lipoprotein [Legionellaceae bacterium]
MKLFITITLISLLLCSCGQRGPLYLPSTTQHEAK